MHNDSIKIDNKIITSKDLLEIFNIMNETFEQYKKTHILEEQKNKLLESNYQKWTFKDAGSKLNFIVHFFDSTNNVFENYDDFINTFNNRINEIKKIDVEYNLIYDTDSLKDPRIRYNQSINMCIKENSINIEFNLNNQDAKLDSVFSLIKTKIADAPEMIDIVLKDKNKIINTISLSIGLIPSMIILLLLLLIPIIRNIYFQGYVIYPICSILLALLLGSIYSSKKIKKYYENFSIEKKNSNNGSKDQKEICEVLIGSNINNIDTRSIIINEYNKYKKALSKELIGLIIVSIVIVLIGIFI